MSRGATPAWTVAGTWLICIALVPAIGYGLFANSAYRGFTHEVVLTSRAQDVLTALALPVLLTAVAQARRGSLAGHIVALGLYFYLVYSYGLYLIGWELNRAFLAYVFTVSMSAALLFSGLARIDVERVLPAVARVHTKGVGWFLAVIGVLFGLLWLSDLAPAILGNGMPSHVGLGGTPYPVYVLDLTFALPVVVAVGVSMIRNRPMSAVLGGVVLVKVTTLFVALWLGVLVAMLAGEEVAFTADMVPSALLLVVMIVALLRGRARLAAPRDGWLRPEVWSATDEIM